MRMTYTRGCKFSMALIAAVTLAQCSRTDLATPTSPGAVAPTSSNGNVVGDTVNSTPTFGQIRVCKVGNVNGTYTVSAQAVNNGNPSVLSPITVNSGTCRVVAEDFTTENGSGSNVTLTETSPGLQSITALRMDAFPGNPVTNVPFVNGDTVPLNAGHAWVITFTNDVPPPPAQLVVSKTPDGGTFNQGAQISFTIVVSNPAAAGSSSATGVTLTDALPGNGGLVWATASTTQGSCVSPIVANNLSCSLGTIAPQGSVTVTVTSTATTPDAACQSQPNPAAIATSGSLTAQNGGSLSCTPPPPPGNEGCTPGYWKQDHHFDSYPAPFTPTTDFDATFGVNFFSPNIGLAAAADANGGDTNALARHAVAALLNAASDAVAYQYTSTQVLQIVQGVGPYAGLSVEARKNLLAAANERDCPLN